MGEKIQEICWVYRVPIPDTGEANFENTRETDPSQADLPKEERANMYSPKYLVFRRTARTAVPAITHKLLPLTSKGIAEAKAKADAAKKAKADAEAAKKKART